MTIPRILHRTVPAERDPQVDTWWNAACGLHFDWLKYDWVEPLDPEDFPWSHDLWPLCESGAQKAGLVRLEALWIYGGHYLDSDVEVFQSFEPLAPLHGYAAWEDQRCAPDAIMGFEAGHPALLQMMHLARKAIEQGDGPWLSGPGVTTAVLPGRPDVLLLPPGAFFEIHYLEKRRLNAAPKPWEFARHHWAGSWLTPEQKRRNERRQR